MAYGLKVWTAAGYIAFDSEQMDSYVKVVASGTVQIGNNSSETISVGSTGYDYVYGMGPTVNVERSFTISETSTSFTITNVSGQSNFFGYVAIKLN
jgi:hypothetical protein